MDLEPWFHILMRSYLFCVYSSFKVKSCLEKYLQPFLNSCSGISVFGRSFLDFGSGQNRKFCCHNGSTYLLLQKSEMLLPKSEMTLPGCGLLNPNSNGVNYSLIVFGGGGFLHHVSVLTSLLVNKYFFKILNWNFRYLSWQRQYETGNWRLFRCNQMPSTWRNTWFTPCVRLRTMKWATI